jgi:dihydropteroate synthase
MNVAKRGIVLACGRHRLALDRPRVMGILNVTPDSFSDGGRFLSPARAIERAWEMRDQGVDVIDIGGESTRPGALPVSESEEIDRVMPVLAALAQEAAFRAIPLSIDTRKPAVMRAALHAGASMINDVTALRAGGAVELAAAGDVAVCLMHMQGEPATMQAAPAYDDVVQEVRTFLAERAAVCMAAGIASNRIVLDPGFGFGKRRSDNLALLRHLDVVTRLGFPVLCGLSRKNVITAPTHPASTNGIGANIAAALAAASRGALMLRVHDVRETVDALAVWRAALSGGD